MQLAVTDLQSLGFGSPWQQRRQYSNRLTPIADFGLGYGWLVEGWPYLTNTADGAVSFVQSSQQALWFDEQAGSYVARYGAKATLTHDSGSGQFILTQPSGVISRFNDFSGGSGPPGLFASMTEPGGQVTEAISYTAAGRVETIQRQTNVDGVTVSEQFHYDFNSQAKPQRSPIAVKSAPAAGTISAGSLTNTTTAATRSAVLAI